jgi:hypothetical protein
MTHQVRTIASAVLGALLPGLAGADVQDVTLIWR